MLKTLMPNVRIPVEHTAFKTNAFWETMDGEIPDADVEAFVASEGKLDP